VGSTTGAAGSAGATAGAGVAAGAQAAASKVTISATKNRRLILIKSSSY
jgi:hypothetical protein